MLKDDERAITLLKNLMVVVERLIEKFKLNLSVSPAHVINFLHVYKFIDMQSQDRELEHKLVTIEPSMSDENLGKALVTLLKIRLCDFYKIIGDLLHNRSMYKEAYLAMNYHNNLYVDLAGDQTIQSYQKVIDLIEKQAETSSNDVEDKEFFKRPWVSVRHNKTNQEGFLMSRF